MRVLAGVVLGPSPRMTESGDYVRERRDRRQIMRGLPFGRLRKLIMRGIGELQIIISVAELASRKRCRI